MLRGFLTGVGGGLMWFIIYASYALAFWYGVKLIMDDREACLTSLLENCNVRYDPSSLLIVFFSGKNLSLQKNTIPTRSRSVRPWHFCMLLEISLRFAGFLHRGEQEKTALSRGNAERFTVNWVRSQATPPPLSTC